MGLNTKAPVLAGVFLISIFSLPDWVELIGSLDVVCFEWVRCVWGLTRFFGALVVDFWLGGGGWKSLPSAERLRLAAQLGFCTPDGVQMRGSFASLRMTT
jgi:hypothetical protein